MPDEHPIPAHTDELAIRLFRAHFSRSTARESSAQTIDDLQPGMAGVWRMMALSVQDVLGVEGVAHAMAAMDNIANSTSNTDRIRANDEVIIQPMDAARRALGGAA